MIIKNLEGGGKHIFLRCRLNGADSMMLVDTGSSNTIFDSSSPCFADLKFKEIEQKESYSVNASIEGVKYGKIDCLSIGDFSTPINKAFFMSLDQVNQLYEKTLGFRIIGIIGSDFLKKHKAIIDFEDKKISWRK
ncbi:MAG: aspartyl protease family protein [Bacteroidales bacterium]|nr:aspartyl protease family protein [Bacteroidales bacterium]